MSDILRTLDFTEKLQRKVIEDPSKSAFKLVEEMGVGKSTIGEYVAQMRDVVAPWINRVAAGMPFIFQQDSAPCHTSCTSQKWLLENLEDYISPNIWPPVPQLKPLRLLPVGRG